MRGTRARITNAITCSAAAPSDALSSRMAEVHLWGRIQQIGVREHVVTVTVRLDPMSPAETAEVHERIADSREAARELRSAMLMRVGAIVRERGDCIIDVVDDG
jgi:hypothetical protein